MDKVKVKVPTLFWNDHKYRSEHNVGNVLKAGKLLTEVELTKEQFDDLLSDADCYADFKNCSFDYAENKNIVDSAINTLKRLKEIEL